MSRHQPQIVVVGSLNMDFVLRCQKLPQPGETVAGHGSNTIPGGKGANQAAAAARLGARVAMIGRVGDDPFGRTLKHCLEREGIDVSSIHSTADTPSGMALITVSRHGASSSLPLRTEVEQLLATQPEAGKLQDPLPNLSLL